MILLAGATASGKSSLAQLWAERSGAAILSADAMLVYQGMDIGTAKPTHAERARVPYYGVDCVTPEQSYSTQAWLAEAQRAQAEHDALIVTGGTGLYFSALLRGLDPTPEVRPELRAELEALPLAELQARLAAHGETIADQSNPRRLVRALEILLSGGTLPKAWHERTKPALAALTWPRALLHARIAQRVQIMYADGVVEETEALLQRYPQWSRTAAQAIGYAEAAQVLTGELTRAEAMERTVIRTRQLARRQETYLRGQFEMTWIDASAFATTEALLAHVQEVLHG